jgi:hypothetical protein
MISRTLWCLPVLAMAVALSCVLIGHLWDCYSRDTEALGFTGIYERYLARQAGFPDDPQAYRVASAGGIHEAVLSEE